MIHPKSIHHIAAAITNINSAKRGRPCRSCPNPGTIKLQSAAITFPPDPCPAMICIRFVQNSTIPTKNLLFCLGIKRLFKFLK